MEVRNIEMEEDLAKQRGEQSVSHNGEVRSLAEAIGDEEFEWTAPGGELTCTFGRPKGFISLVIADALGPERESSASWLNVYRALAGIRSWNGTNVAQPSKSIHFDAALKRFNIGDGCEDLYLNNFVFTFGKLTNPALQRGLEEIMDEKLGPEDAARVMDEVSKATTKKSRNRRTVKA